MENKDFVVARLAAARASLVSATDGIDALIESFLDSSEETDRDEVFEDVIDDAGIATRAIECAQHVYENLDKEERDAGEPDYDEILDTEEEEEADSTDDAA